MLDFISFITYIVVTAATPGPNNVMSMVNASKWGFRRSMAFNFGIWLGMSLVVLLCTMVGNAIYGLLPSIQTPMQFLGAGYMLYLAWTILQTPKEMLTVHAPSLFASGMLLQFINVKYYVYCIISMQVYILPYYQGQILKLVGFAFLLSTVGFVFTVLWAWAGSLLKTVFTHYAKIINPLLALCLVYCAVSLFL